MAMGHNTSLHFNVGYPSLFFLFSPLCSEWDVKTLVWTNLHSSRAYEAGQMEPRRQVTDRRVAVGLTLGGDVMCKVKVQTHIFCLMFSHHHCVIELYLLNGCVSLLCNLGSHVI